MPVFRSAYEARRAAQLSGVPTRTVYKWAETGLVVPSVSRTREMLWSYSDLVTLRLIDWLRREKLLEGDTESDEVKRFKRTSIPSIREALASLELLGGDLTNDSVQVEVDRGGAIVLTISGDRYTVGLQMMERRAARSFDLLGAHDFAPALAQPMEHVSIAPGTLSGQPHVTGKRVPTDIVADMADQGFVFSMIVAAYPSLDDAEVGDAVAFEHGLAA